jgi:cytochrome c oxidase assembly factor 6
MSWVPWGSGQQGPKPSSDGGFIAPDRSERAKCWEARDKYYTCLDKADIIDPIANAKVVAKHCPNEEKTFEQNCAQSWVSTASMEHTFDTFAC